MDSEAFILIGGSSTRFGSDKAFFVFEGETLAGRSAAVVREAHPGGVVRFIAASEVQFGGRIERLVEEIGGELVFDRSPGRGAWSGLDTALSASKAEWTLVLACDLAFVTAHLLSRLMTACRGDVDAAVPRQEDGRLQPLCAVYRTQGVLPLLERQVVEGGRMPPLHSLFQQVRTTVIDAGPGELRNINTPADLD